ncbi:CoA transferase [Streptomyces sp. NPDC052042]|uniref:CoA transferase n=1 Tax=Streptomyces sp. NPDC052042 TaxID=3365683 RepID=UPI0037D2212E
MQRVPCEECFAESPRPAGPTEPATDTPPATEQPGTSAAPSALPGAKRVIVLMEHLARDGSCKVVNECSLPCTGRGVVQRIITDPAVIDVTPDGLRLVETAPGVTEDDVRKATEPPPLTR